MNIAIISRARTVSSAVVNTLATKYNLNNEFELYHVIGMNLHFDKNVKNMDDESKLAYFEKLMLAKTDEFFSRGNFICKIWPCMFTYHIQTMLPSWTLENVKKKTIFNISKLFRFDQYDQLYYLDRSVYDTTSSWVYSRKINVFHTHRNRKHITPVITLEPMDYSLAKFHVLEYCLQQKVKRFLIDKQIPFTDISETYNDYIDESLLTTTKSEHDYASLITDYDKLHNSITEWKEYFFENTKDWQFT